MITKKILPLFNLALGSKLLYHEPIELPFDIGESSKVVGNVQNLNYTKTTSIKFYTPNDIQKTYNGNSFSGLSALTDFDITIYNTKGELVVKNLPISTLTFDTNAQKFLILDLPFVEIDWTRTTLRRSTTATQERLYFGVFYIRNKEFEELIK